MAEPITHVGSGNFMERDPFLINVLEQPAVLSRLLVESTKSETRQKIAALQRALGSGDGLVVFTGMGSSYAAAIPAVMYLNKSGIPALVVSSSTLVYYETNLLDLARLLVVVSQSGESAEVVRLMENIKVNRNSTVTVGVTNEPSSQLAQMADFQLYLNAGTEATVTSKSYTATVMLLMLLAEGLVQDSRKQCFEQFEHAVESLSDFLTGWRSHVEDIGDFIGDPDYLYLIARGPSLATIEEGALIIKELAKLPAEGIEGGAFRHGPIEIVDEGFTSIVVSHQGVTYDRGFRLSKQIADFGGKVLLVSNKLQKLENSHIMQVLVAEGLTEYVAPIVDIVPVQVLAAHLAIKRGYKGGGFRHIGKVTKVD